MYTFVIKKILEDMLKNR